MAPLVLHVVHSLAAGGLEAMAVDLALTTDRRRYRAAIACLREGGVFARRAAGAGVEVHVLGFPPGFRPRIAPALAGLARRLGASLLHSHNAGALLYAAPAAALAGLPLVHTEHGREPETPGRSPLGRARRALLRAAERRALARAARVVAVAPAVADALAPLLPGRAAEVVPNGVTAAPPEPGRRDAARAALPLAPERLAIGMIGRLEPIKGADVLLDAVAPILTRRTAATLVFIGDGSLRASLAARAGALGVGGRVLFAGFRDDARSLLPALDVVVVPSRSEGIPLALLEAMAVGRPVVATAVGGCPFALGDAGLLVAPDAPAELAAAIERLLDDPVLATELGARASRRVAARFSGAAMAADYMRLYDRTRGVEGDGAALTTMAAAAGESQP